VHGDGELRERLARLRCELAGEAEGFHREHDDAIEAYRRQISAGVQEALQGFRDDLGRLSGHDPLCRTLADSTASYVEWFQWALWDLPAFAVALRPEPARFRRAVASCGMVYLSIRLLDDVVDRHFLYRGKRRTLLASLTDLPQGGRADALTLLAGVLLCLHGIARLLGDGDDAFAGSAGSRRMLERVVGRTQRVLTGLVLELSAPEAWDDATYERLVELKNVDYSRILWAALDPAGRSPLGDFLGRYYALAQMLNDVEDHPQDEQRGQPNLISLVRMRAAADGAGGGVRREVEAIVGGAFLELGERAAALPPAERGVARLKLHESLETAVRLGLFAAAAEAPAAAPTAAARTTLGAASQVEEVLESLGPEALEAVACGVCGGEGGAELFRKHGFAVRRCERCSHVYVSPRLAVGLPPAGGDGDAGLAPFFAVERLLAAVVCDLVETHCEGRRWLCYGVGGGHLLRQAAARGAQVYAADESPEALEAVRPVLGRLCAVGRAPDELPWGPHDAVLLPHTGELFRAPRATLEKVARALRPDGLLYLAVPDAGSVHFRTLGRHWEAIAPLLRWHYFARAPLERLLADCGFEVVQWVEHPPLPEAVAAPWMRLFRGLGGSEAGELAVLARPVGRRPR
jgi:SAM-dependent methyltransferase